MTKQLNPSFEEWSDEYRLFLQERLDAAGVKGRSKMPDTRSLYDKGLTPYQAAFLATLGVTPLAFAVPEGAGK